MSRFMLDTNTVSAVISGRRPGVRRPIRLAGVDNIFVSVVSYAETMFGIRKKPEATKVAALAKSLFEEITILAWTYETASVYATLRADLGRQGITLGALDMMIAAHAVEVGAVLVTADRAFRNVPGLVVENWTEA